MGSDGQYRSAEGGRLLYSLVRSARPQTVVEFGPIGLVLLDGWKDLYLPVLRLLEPRLSPGALVIADDSTFATVQPYLAYVRDPANGYVSVSFPVDDGMEVSCHVG